MYALTCDSSGQLYLEVIQGGFAMENVVMPLSSEETRDYEERGKGVLDDLAFRILKQKSRFESRFVE